MTVPLTNYAFFNLFWTGLDLIATPNNVVRTCTCISISPYIGMQANIRLVVLTATISCVVLSSSYKKFVADNGCL